jgi:hypothetical protein
MPTQSRQTRWRSPRRCPSPRQLRAPGPPRRRAIPVWPAPALIPMATLSLAPVSQTCPEVYAYGREEALGRRGDRTQNTALLRRPNLIVTAAQSRIACFASRSLIWRGAWVGTPLPRTKLLGPCLKVYHDRGTPSLSLDPD